MSEQGLVFGSVADAYEEHRLGYPDAVADLVLAYAAPPVATVLEVGAGTGKATRLFAGRGLAVTALEPDAAMAAVLRRTTAGLPVAVVEAPFEQAQRPAEGPYDLVLSAQAWHWTDPTTRWDRAVALLRRGGTVALLGIVEAGSVLLDRALDARVHALERAVLPNVVQATAARSPRGTWWPGSELEEDVRFADVEEHDVTRVLRRTRDDHVAMLTTFSPYLRLERGARTTLLSRVAAVLPDEVEVDATVRLHLARRVGGDERVRRGPR